jgi:hypothetical protein
VSRSRQGYLYAFICHCFYPPLIIDLRQRMPVGLNPVSDGPQAHPVVDVLPKLLLVHRKYYTRAAKLRARKWIRVPQAHKMGSKLPQIRRLSCGSQVY